MKVAAWLAAWLLVGGTAHANCFGEQMPQAEWAAAAAASSLRLALTRPDGKAVEAASGVVVAASGAPNRVLTGGRLARDMARVPGGWIAAWSSSGRYLGRLEPVAATSPRPARLSAQVMPSGVRAGDVAVLRATQLSADGARLYAAIPGLSLARRQPVGLLMAEVSDPAGADADASGAGVIGPDGGLLGVLVAKPAAPTEPRVDARAGNAAGGPARRVRLPLRATGYALPLSDPAILAALGPAGAGIAQARGPLRERATIPAYVAGACVVFRAEMGPG